MDAQAMLTLGLYCGARVVHKTLVKIADDDGDGMLSFDELADYMLITC